MAKKSYPEEFKKDAIEKVNEYNRNHNGRGGVTTVAEELELKRDTLDKWCKAAAESQSENYTEKGDEKSKPTRPVKKVRKKIAKKSKRGRPKGKKGLEASIAQQVKKITKIKSRVDDLQQQLIKEKSVLDEMIGV